MTLQKAESQVRHNMQSVRRGTTLPGHLTADILSTFAISVRLHFYHSLGQCVIERLKIIYKKVIIPLFNLRTLGRF
jgi:hypothetical protein